MRVTVVTIWPTYIDDLGKPPVYRIAYPHDHTPAWGPALNAPGTYRNKADAQAMADRINGYN